MALEIVKHRQEDGVDIIQVLEKRIFLDLTDKFRAKVVEIIDKRAEKVVFDLSSVNVMNSSGLGVLILARDKLEKKGGKIAVCGLSPLMEDIFTRMQFKSFFTVTENIEQAKASFE